MPSLAKARLYLDTARHLKPSQVLYRVWRKAGGATPLKAGHAPRATAGDADVSRIALLPELDFDPAFLARFDCEAILRDELTLLHHTERVDWETCWNAGLSTPLWQFNLHYCEYLLPLAKRYLDGSDERCLAKAKSIVRSWIRSNGGVGSGAGWDPYTISMRLVNWLAFYGELEDALEGDRPFVDDLNGSLASQYAHLARHLEKDLLANHYFENLKALVLGALYFGDDGTLDVALPLLEGQAREQILPDGMHFELSPMYHKVILEDVLRVAASLDKNGRGSEELRGCVRRMCDCLYSLERNASRTPLFNDSGDNVAKHKDALLACAKMRFGVEPRYREDVPDAGYYLMERECSGHVLKLIFDAGGPGPEYAMGHAHCDALSFEAFVDGEPWIVNCGTYAYQDPRRLDFKRTSFHSTVMIEGCEQSECWAPFRVGRRATSRLEARGLDSLCAVMTDARGRGLRRTVSFSDGCLNVADEAADEAGFACFWHLAFGEPPSTGDGRRAFEETRSALYSPGFGLSSEIASYAYKGAGAMTFAWRVPVPSNVSQGGIS